MSGENIRALAEYQEQHRNGHAPQAPVPDDQLIRRMSDVSSRTIRWAWIGRLALGYITVQTGEEGLGKSVFAAWLAARATRGELEGVWHSTPVDVLIVAGEDGQEDTWQPRLTLAGADLERVASLNLDAFPVDWNVRDGIGELRRAVVGTRAKLVVFDALFDHMPPAVGGENINSPTYVRGALAPLKDLVKDLGIVAIISLHPPKARGAAFRDLVQASQAFSAIPRLGLYFGWHPDDAEDDPERRRVLVRGKGNIGRNPGALEFRVAGREHLHGDGLLQEREVVVDVIPSDVTLARLVARPRGSGDETQSKAEDAAEILRERLADGDWHPAGPIRDGLDALDLDSNSVVSRAKQLAGVKVRKEHGSLHGGWEWQIPKKPDTPPISLPLVPSAEEPPKTPYSSEESKKPCPGTTVPSAVDTPRADNGPEWRVSPGGMWLSAARYPPPAGATDIEWKQPA